MMQLGIAVVIGAVCGVASAVFLALLDGVTNFRQTHEAIVYALPLAGLALGAVYERYGTSIKGGTTLILSTIRNNTARLPLRLAPMVLFGTLLTHLFGGSVGREGTAVQMGAGLADQIAHWCGIKNRSALLIAGVAGGFGSVFGTPLAGALFGIEVVVRGRLQYRALLPALISAIVGDQVTRSLGTAHTAYPNVQALPLSFPLLLKWLVFASAIALCVIAFVELMHACKQRLELYLPRLAWRLCAGGVLVVALWKLVGTSEYLGLGIPVLLRSFSDPSLVPHAFAAKLVFTVITVSTGFVGGEVTPLFVIGATLGSSLATPLGIPIEMGAGVGMAAMFGAAAKAPIALCVMATELLGVQVLPHVATVMIVAGLLTWRRGIYQ